MNNNPIRNLLCCSLTGASDDVDPSVLLELSHRYPFVEWGILYSSSRSGQDPRYPSVEWIRRFAHAAADSGMRCALHLCGEAVFDALLERHGTVAPSLVGLFGRVQMNFTQSKRPVPVDRLQTFINGSRGVVITQENRANTGVNQSLISPRHAILFDASGGRGIEAAEWPWSWAPPKVCGYAGGLGPDNVARELPRIAAAAGTRPFWIDMEGKLRDATDRFDLTAVSRVLHAVTGLIEVAPIVATVSSSSAAQGVTA